MTSPYVEASSKSTRTERELRAKREAALEQMRQHAKEQGVSETLIRESEASMRAAFAQADMWNSVFAHMGLK